MFYPSILSSEKKIIFQIIKSLFPCIQKHFYSIQKIDSVRTSSFATFTFEKAIDSTTTFTWIINDTEIMQ